MKRFCIIFFLLLAMSYSVQAQDITGKWKCSKELLDRLQLRYDDIKGHYIFKKNGKFKLKIKGIKRTQKYWGDIDAYNRTYTMHSNHRPLSIMVSGRYEIKNEKVSAYVKPKDVKVYVDEGANPPCIPDINTSDYEYREIEDQRLRYNDNSYKANIQASMIKAEKWFMWSWRDLSVRQTGDSLVIGKIIKLTK